MFIDVKSVHECQYFLKWMKKSFHCKILSNKFEWRSILVECFCIFIIVQERILILPLEVLIFFSLLYLYCLFFITQIIITLFVKRASREVVLSRNKAFYLRECKVISTRSFYSLCVLFVVHLNRLRFIHKHRSQYRL